MQLPFPSLGRLKAPLGNHGAGASSCTVSRSIRSSNAPLSSRLRLQAAGFSLNVRLMRGLGVARSSVDYPAFLREGRHTLIRGLALGFLCHGKFENIPLEIRECGLYQLFAI